MTSRFLLAVVGGVVFAASHISCVAAQAPGPATCSGLTQLHLPNLTVTATTPVDAPLTVGRGLGGVTVSTPFCRVAGFLTPTSDSHIGFELWLPPADVWNHKFEAVGNGGFQGSLNFRAMLPAFSRGYATMTTDLGHLNAPDNPVEDATWALGHPEKVVDYEYRAEHLSTEVSKQIINYYYGANAAHSYYSGCSAGGIQGMTELLRYPKDFDGYVLGDATPDHMGQELAAMWNTLLASSLASPADEMQPSQISLLHAAVLKQCAGKDGGLSTDQFLTDPSACKFDPGILTCAAGQDASTCLSAAQIAEVKKIFQGPTDSRTHAQLISPITPGAEATWDRYISGKKNPIDTERPWAGFMADIAFSDADFLTGQKYLTFNWGYDLDTIRNKKIDAETLDAIFNEHTRNLDPVKDEGGKVIQYHGWDDANIPPMEAVRFFNSVVADQAQRHHLTSAQALEKTKEFYRLFMVPGMGHCAGGAGANAFGQGGTNSLNADPQTDTLSALELWVEKGIAPDTFTGSHMDAKTKVVDMTRPICAFPKVPTYKGTGNASEAGSFVCADKAVLKHP